MQLNTANLKDQRLSRVISSRSTPYVDVVASILSNCYVLRWVSFVMKAGILVEKFVASQIKSFK